MVDAVASTAIKAGADDAKWYWLEEGRSAGGFIREVDFAANSRGVDPLFAGIKIVDCDTHFTEPADLWTANAPAGMMDKMPHVRRIDNADQWYVGDKHFGSIGGNVIAKDKNKLLGKLAFQNYDQIAPGSYDVAERLLDMDAMGVWAQICFQNGGVTQAGSLVALNDQPLAISITQIYNDACADPELVLEGDKTRRYIEPIDGATTQKMIEAIYQTSPDVVAKIRSYVKPPATP